MAYIYLDELKDVLPAIMDQWIDGDDESWEWIFQEIEQKCHVGKRLKGKKQKKRVEDDVSALKEYVDIHKEDICDLNDWYKKVDELNNRINKLSDMQGDLTSRINRMNQDINAAKSMAQTAKDRTQIDYSKYSGKSDGNINYNKEKSDADVVQEVYNRMAGRGATREELDTFRNLIQKYDALEKKEVPVIKKACETCKSYAKNPFEQPCSQCCYNGINTDLTGLDKWEAKDNG